MIGDIITFNNCYFIFIIMHNGVNNKYHKQINEHLIYLLLNIY